MHPRVLKVKVKTPNFISESYLIFRSADHSQLLPKLVTVRLFWGQISLHTLRYLLLSIEMLAKIALIKTYMVIQCSKFWHLNFDQTHLQAPHFEINPIPPIQWGTWLNFASGTGSFSQIFRELFLFQRKFANLTKISCPVTTDASFLFLKIKALPFLTMPLMLKHAGPVCYSNSFIIHVIQWTGCYQLYTHKLPTRT